MAWGGAEGSLLRISTTAQNRTRWSIIALIWRNMTQIKVLDNNNIVWEKNIMRRGIVIIVVDFDWLFFLVWQKIK